MTTPISHRSLWSAADGIRVFLIPNEQRLPPGDLTLRTITGGEQRVDPTAVALFEVTEEQAKEWVKGEFGKILDNARGAVNQFLERLRGGPGEPDRIVDLRELLDRVEALVELIIAEGPDGAPGSKEVGSVADRVAGIEARLGQFAERLRAARPSDPFIQGIE